MKTIAPEITLPELYALKEAENMCQTGPHMDYLRRLAFKCELAVEYGARAGGSTVALNYAARTISVDFNVRECDQPVWDALKRLRGDAWTFVQADTREYALPECDLLFIDSLHSYDQVSAELRAHESVRKWIVLHDTEKYGRHGQERYKPNATAGEGEHVKGILPAIEEFLEAHEEWTIERQVTNSNGLTTLRRRGS